ncbi:MAG TPA: hypothetical protein VK718_11495 [Ferruginibacter sp.]|jgi:hypothetical protein|nr:hypothetical protein [Ferruginibacter sp.]
MKQFILIAVVLLMSHAGKAQQTSSTPTVDQSNYKIEYKQLRSASSHARVGAIILNVTGIVLCVGGTIVMATGALDQSTKDGDPSGGLLGGSSNDNDIITAGAVMTGAGIVCGIGSWVLYAKSARLYHKAREVKMSMNSNSFAIPQTGARSFRVPQIGMGFSISL